METDAVVGLALQFGVAESILLLDTRSFIITVGSASSRGSVGVEVFSDVCECVPVDMCFYFCEFVSEVLDLFVGFSLQVWVKGFLGVFQVQVFY